MNACIPLATAGGNLNTINLSSKVHIILPIDTLSPSLSSVRTTLAFSRFLPPLGLGLISALVFAASRQCSSGRWSRRRVDRSRRNSQRGSRRNLGVPLVHLPKEPCYRLKNLGFIPLHDAALIFCQRRAYIMAWYQVLVSYQINNERNGRTIKNDQIQLLIRHPVFNDLVYPLNVQRLCTICEPRRTSVAFHNPSCHSPLSRSLHRLSTFSAKEKGNPNPPRARSRFDARRRRNRRQRLGRRTRGGPTLFQPAPEQFRDFRNLVHTLAYCPLQRPV